MPKDFTKTEAIVAEMRRYLHSDPDFDHELHQSAAVESLDHHAVNIVIHCHTSAAATREFCAHAPTCLPRAVAIDEDQVNQAVQHCGLTAHVTVSACD